MRRSEDERGLTVLELTVSLTLMSILSVAALGMLVTTQNRVRFTSNETQSLDGARTTLQRIEREIRDGAKIYEDADCPMATCLTLAMVPPAGGAVLDVRYRYDSATKILYRSGGARNPNTGGYAISGSETPIVRSVVNGSSAVFCRQSPCTTPSETGAVQVTLTVNVDPARPGQAITLTSYATPRNR